MSSRSSSVSARGGLGTARRVMRFAPPFRVASARSVPGCLTFRYSSAARHVMNLVMLELTLHSRDFALLAALLAFGCGGDARDTSPFDGVFELRKAPFENERYDIYG